MELPVGRRSGSFVPGHPEDDLLEAAVEGIISAADFIKKIDGAQLLFS